MSTGPNIPQELRLVTSIPGPKSQEIIKRRNEAVSASLGMAIPVVVERAGGGVIVDVDGNSIIDMGAGIAVVNVGNSADRVVENVLCDAALQPVGSEECNTQRCIIYSWSTTPFEEKVTERTLF